MSRRIAIGIDVEGIGPGPAYPDGDLYVYGEPGLVPSSADWRVLPVVTQVPDSISSRVDLFTGRHDLSAGVFTLVAGSDVLRWAWSYGGTRPSGLSVVEAGASDTTTVDLRLLGTPPAAPTVVYIADETIAVGGWTSLGGGVWRATGIARGYAGSPVQDHENGVAVYYAPPGLKFRRVRLWLFEEGEGPVVLWQGLLDDVSTDEQQTEVELSCVETLSVLVDARGAQERTRVRYQTGDLRYGLDSQGRIRVRGDISGADNGRFEDFDFVRRDRDYFPYFLLGDRAIVQGTPIGGDFAEGIRIGSPGLFGSDLDVEPGFVSPGTTLVEVLCISPTTGAPFQDLYGGLHPAAVALALYLSTGTGGNDPEPAGAEDPVFDVLGQKWGLGVPARFIHWPSWKAIIDEGVDREIDQLFLGVEGPIDYQDVIKRKLLLPAGLYQARRADGTIGLFRRPTFSVAEADRILSAGYRAPFTSDRIRMSRQIPRQRSQVSAEIGKNPFQDGADLDFSVLTGTREDATLSRTDPFVFDLGAYEDTQDARDHFTGVLEREAASRRRNPPVLDCVVPSVSSRGEAPPPGNWIILEGGPVTGMIGPDGGRVLPEENAVLFVGFVVGREMILSDMTSRLEVLLVNWGSSGRAARLVAPAAPISDIDVTAGASTEAVITITSDWPAVEGLGSSGFSEGDQVEIRERHGGRWPKGAVAVVTNVASGTVLEVEALGVGAEAEIHSPTTEELGAGLFLELANWNLYNNNSWPGADFFLPAIGSFPARARRWAYLFAPADNPDDTDYFT